MKYSLEYFNQRILDEIEDWPVGVLAAYARQAELLVGFGSMLGMPYSRALGGGLFELRPRGREGEGRVLHCFATERRIVVLDAFIKKTQATPGAHLRNARRRLREVRLGK